MSRPPGPRIIIAASALATIEAAADVVASCREAGGVLLGVRAGTDVCVTDAIEITGAHASQTRLTTTEADRNNAIAGFRATEAADSPVGYVGTWHSHLGPQGASRVDRRILHREAVAAPDLVAMLVVLRACDGWVQDGYIAHRERALERRRLRQILVRRPWIAPADLVVVAGLGTQTPPG
jgi:hypothetical protein